MLRKRVLSLILVALTGFMIQGCYAKHFSINGEPMPEPAPSPNLPLVAGVTPKNFVAPTGIEVDAKELVQEFAARLEQEKVFKTVVYPYSEMAKVDPDVILDVSCKVTPDMKMDENMIKAVLIGLSMYALAPILPFEYDLAIDIEVIARRPNGDLINTYQGKSAYRFQYTKFLPSEAELNQWILDTQKHAVESAVNAIKNDAAAFSPPRKTAGV